jgi:CelD/BcsL family acetyltransferase involved in cellulose biosynthesis
VTLRLEWVNELDALREDWTPLASRSGNVFATQEFLSVWWRHFGPRETRPLVAAAREENGRLAAIVPLYRWRTRPARVVRVLGHGPGDGLGPIVPADGTAAADALREALAQLPGGFDLFLGEQLPAGSGLAEALGARIVSSEGSPVLGLGYTSWEEFLATKRRNFREQAGRRERKLFREHRCRFRLADDAGRLQDDVGILFSLHDARWEGAHTPFRDHEAFHREFAARALERGWLRLWFLEVDGEPRAAWLGYRFAGAESYFQSGRDPTWDNASVGFVLLIHTIREALADGMLEYRFLRGGERYKYRLADSDPGLVTVALGRGPFGRATVLAAPLVRRARRLLRRRVLTER